MKLFPDLKFTFMHSPLIGIIRHTQRHHTFNSQSCQRYPTIAKINLQLIFFFRFTKNFRLKSMASLRLTLTETTDKIGGQLKD